MSRTHRLRPLAGLVAMGLSAPAFAGSVQFPTYVPGPQADGSFVVGNGQVITPAGTQVDLGDRVRAKAVAVNPKTASHTAAVLVMGANQAVEVFDTLTGEVLQNYVPGNNTKTTSSDGSYSGLTYSADGKHLLISGNNYGGGPSTVTYANVSSQGLLTDDAIIPVPPNNSFIKCFPNSPLGDYGRTCGTFYSTGTSYPGAVALSSDGKSAYALLNQNNTLARIDLVGKKEGAQIRVGNAPHSLVVLNGKTAYVSNEGGRVATEKDFQIYSAGTPIVADKVTGHAITGTVSVVDLATMKVTGEISTGGLHPTGMALYGTSLLVSNTYSDTISVIDTATNKVTATIHTNLPIGVPGAGAASYGNAPVGIAVDSEAKVAYVALYNANAVAVIDLTKNAVLGAIPVAYAPSSVAIDKADGVLIVANDKGVGTRYSYETDHGVTGYNTHQDNGTVSIVTLPASPITVASLSSMSAQVSQNNHWDLSENIKSAGGGSKSTKPVALPAKIGDPSLIKHVFLIIRENRTYDQILGDVAKGHGDAQLAVFGGKDTPNAHALLKRFPLFDNFYDPSRQSADGHQWIVEGMAPYQDDIQAPDWTRSYPGGNAGDALAYINQGFLFSEAVAAGLKLKIFGEYVENQTKSNTLNNASDGGWQLLYKDSQAFEAGKEKTLKFEKQIEVKSSIPAVSKYLNPNFPQFDLNIPDQYRVDLWLQDFDKDVKAGDVPALSILWIMDDHTGGPPTADAEQADNDLAVGRIIDYISHSKVWDSSAIFIEEDDAQNGVDHIDGHRSPGYIVSPYVKQTGNVDHTFYTQVSMTRTIEQILGLSPLNQFDLVASPMATAFVTGTPPKANFEPWTHVANQVPLDLGDAPAAEPASKLEADWMKAKSKMFAGKTTKPDSQDADVLSHLNWYEATHFARPYPGESAVRPASDFKDRLLGRNAEDADGDGD
jgi:YVTN family beta-propeller protein